MLTNATLVAIEAAVTNGLEDFHTLLIGKIVELDNTGRSARIEFLQKTIATRKGCPIQSPPEIDYFIPILPIFNSIEFSVYAPYYVGDKVIISVFERPYDEPFDSNESQEQQDTGRGQIRFSVISKAIPQDMLTGSEPYKDDFTILHKSSGNFIQITSNGLINIQGNVNIKGDIDVTGDLKVSGKGEFDGEITSSTDVKSNSISLISHTHSGVTSGSGNTGGPQ